MIYVIFLCGLLTWLAIYALGGWAAVVVVAAIGAALLGYVGWWLHTRAWRS